MQKFNKFRSGMHSYQSTISLNGHSRSSTFESSWVTFCDKFWILSWREFVLWKILFVSAHNSPKRSSACLEMLLSCRIIPHKVFTETASSSFFSPSASCPRLSSIGCTGRFMSGMADYQVNRHRLQKSKIPACFTPPPVNTKIVVKLLNPEITTHWFTSTLKHPTWRLPLAHNSLWASGFVGKLRVRRF